MVHPARQRPWSCRNPCQRRRARCGEIPSHDDLVLRIGTSSELKHRCDCIIGHKPSAILSTTRAMKSVPSCVIEPLDKVLANFTVRWEREGGKPPSQSTFLALE